jgi:hypothetical protein
MWHKAQAQPGKVGLPGPTSLAGQLGVGVFSNSTLPTCQGRSVHGVSSAQSQCGHKTWPPGHPSWSVGPTSGPLSPTFSQSTDLTPYKYPHTPPDKRCEESEV